MLHHLLASCGRIFTKGKLSILIYHQVPQLHDEMRAAEPDAAAFRWQMALIAKYYTPLSLTEAVARLKSNELPANAICVTFDDGYQNNLTVAAPILAEFNIPATVFVATAFIDGANMWNDRVIDLCADLSRETVNLDVLSMKAQALHDIGTRKKLAYQVIDKIKYFPYAKRVALIDTLYQHNNQSEYAPRMMTAQQLKTLSDLGIEIGAHTVDHPILKVLSKEQQYQQISQSKSQLESIIDKPVTSFAYPNGKANVDYDNQGRDLVKSLGFELAVSTNWGISTTDTDHFQLNRFSPWDKQPSRYHIRLLRNALGI